MAEKKESKTINFLTLRYPPNNRFINGAFKEQKEVSIRKDNFGESVVDKESYRLSLTSKRGAIGRGSAYIGQYMFDDGKYDINKDFSYALRKDLSIVELDQYIESKKQELENADKLLKEQIESEIAAAESLKAEKSNANSAKDTPAE